MTAREIIDYIDADVPGLTGYAYQATTWCPDCGVAIARRILLGWERDGKLPDIITHDDLCDTNQFPVPITCEETDYCDHCGPITPE